MLSVTCTKPSPCSWCAFIPSWTSDSLLVCSPFSILPNWKSCTARSPRHVPSRSKWWPHRLRELSSGLCQSTRKLNTSLKWWNAARTTSWAGSSTRVRRAVLCWQPLSRAAWLMSGHWGVWQQLQSKPSENRPPCDALCSFLFPVLGRKDHAIDALAVPVRVRPWEEGTEINLVPAQVGWISVPMAGTGSLSLLCFCSCNEKQLFLCSGMSFHVAGTGI